MEVTPSIPAKSTGRSLDSQTKRAENQSNPALDFLLVGLTLGDVAQLVGSYARPRPSSCTVLVSNRGALPAP